MWKSFVATSTIQNHNNDRIKCNTLQRTLHWCKFFPLKGSLLFHERWKLILHSNNFRLFWNEFWKVSGTRMAYICLNMLISAHRLFKFTWNSLKIDFLILLSERAYNANGIHLGPSRSKAFKTSGKVEKDQDPLYCIHHNVKHTHPAVPAFYLLNGCVQGMHDMMQERGLCWSKSSFCIIF